MKKRIRLTESDLHRVIKESVRKILKETKTPKRKIKLHESVFFEEEERVLREYGLDPQLVSKLCDVDKIPVYTYDSKRGFEWTEDFGIDIYDDDISIRINGYLSSTSEYDGVIDDIKEMCDEVRNGTNPKKVWYSFTRKLDLGY